MLETVVQQSFTDADIARMAIRHEERGHHFYTVLARATFLATFWYTHSPMG